MIYFFIFLFIYSTVVFLLIPKLVPFYTHKFFVSGSNISSDLIKSVAEIKTNYKTKHEVVEKIYELITSKYQGSRVGFLMNLKSNFVSKDIYSISDKTLPCHLFNQILGELLIFSGYFTEKDIIRKKVFLNCFIHQYLVVATEKGNIELDPTYRKMGVPMGKHAQYFV